jgi:hypothetical protein
VDHQPIAVPRNRSAAVHRSLVGLTLLAALAPLILALAVVVLLIAPALLFCLPLLLWSAMRCVPGPVVPSRHRQRPALKLVVSRPGRSTVVSSKVRSVSAVRSQAP